MENQLAANLEAEIAELKSRFYPPLDAEFEQMLAGLDPEMRRDLLRDLYTMKVRRARGQLSALGVATPPH